ncbi:hypothetical protein GON09_005191 [Rhodococcus sp. B50]|nr:hypothetical protein [Rhodococcus sp. B50]
MDGVGPHNAKVVQRALRTADSNPLRRSALSGSSPATAGDGKRPSAWKALTTNRDLMLLSLAGFGWSWGTYGFVTWPNALLIKGRDVSGITAGFIVAIFAGVAVVSKPLTGMLGDRIGSARKPAIVILALFAVILIFFGTLDNVPALLIAAPILGLAGYGYLPLIVATIPRLVSSQVTGTGAGASNAFWQIPSTLAPSRAARSSRPPAVPGSFRGPRRRTDDRRSHPVLRRRERRKDHRRRPGTGNSRHHHILIPTSQTTRRPPEGDRRVVDCAVHTAVHTDVTDRADHWMFLGHSAAG